jgi:hypothetical protein
MGLQKFKLHLANSVFTEENSSLKSMDTTQLLVSPHLPAELCRDTLR